MFIKPAADAPALQGVVQPPGKGLVRMAVADETGIKLKWLIPKGGQVTDEIIRQTPAAQKHLENVTLLPF